MKALIVLTVVCFGSALAEIPDGRVLKQQIFNGFVTKMKSRLGGKMPIDVPVPLAPILPALPDPIRFPDGEFDLGENDLGIEARGSIADAVLEGQSSWTDDLKLNILTQKVTYRGDIQSMQFSSDYSAWLMLPHYFFPLTYSGNGKAEASIDAAHFDVGLTLAVNFTTTRVYVKNVDLNLNFDSAHLFAENVKFLDFEIIDWDHVNEMLKPNFDAAWASSKPICVEVLTEVINSVVGHYTLAEIIAMLLELIGGGPKP